MYAIVLFLKRNFSMEGKWGKVWTSTQLWQTTCCYMPACLGGWSWAHIFSSLKKHEDCFPSPCVHPPDFPNVCSFSHVGFIWSEGASQSRGAPCSTAHLTTKASRADTIRPCEIPQGRARTLVACFLGQTFILFYDSTNFVYRSVADG